MTPALLAILNALVAASANAAQLASLFQTIRSEGRDPTPQEWANLDAADRAARDAFQAVIDHMPEQGNATASAQAAHTA